MSDWTKWDENNPPAPGEYVVWHPLFLRPGGGKVWSFRVRDSLLPYTKIKGNKLHPIWFNEGGWEADGAPEYYCPFPLFPGVDAIAAQQPGESA